MAVRALPLSLLVPVARSICSRTSNARPRPLVHNAYHRRHNYHSCPGGLRMSWLVLSGPFVRESSIESLCDCLSTWSTAKKSKYTNENKSNTWTKNAWERNQPMTLRTLYEWFMENTDVHDINKSSWQNSVRHNLSLNDTFRNISRLKEDNKKERPSTPRSYYPWQDWGFDPTTELSSETASYENMEMSTPTPPSAMLYSLDSDVLESNLDDSIFRDVLNELSTADVDLGSAMDLAPRGHVYTL
ncbi:hypothetical protein Micbo1qcDRAFT_181057 [Microdochium bolleyi]|uniref:Fork-head domain-containing protein n=1 Tax=Microdochium bolleyi TaxID=196109 RepID=A0A136IJL6_9PEZI|nr:hypothetical protein Micbo1qcDRAFT_181057 [Microdochium bolleyi]